MKTKVKRIDSDVNMLFAQVSNANDSLFNSTVQLDLGVSAVGLTVYQNGMKLNVFPW